MRLCKNKIKWFSLCNCSHAVLVAMSGCSHEWYSVQCHVAVMVEHMLSVVVLLTRVAAGTKLTGATSIPCRDS
jgi:hypothetical protein